MHPELAFLHTGPGWWYLISHNLTAAEGWLPLVASLIGIGYALWRRERGDAVLGAFALAYFVLISLAASRYARYEIPLLPILALWAVRPLADLARRRRSLALAAGIVVVLSMAPQLFDAVRPMTRPDVRDVIARRIFAMSQQPACIGFASTPWFWSPPLNPYFSLPEPWRWKQFSYETRGNSALTGDEAVPFDITVLQTRRPDVVLLSELEYYDRLRLGEPAALAYCSYLRAHYSIQAYCIADPFARLFTIDGMPASTLPPDMLYASPITLICFRNPG
jgi:hypothetical protein